MQFPSRHAVEWSQCIKAIGMGGDTRLKNLFFLISSSFKIWIMEVAKLFTELKNLDPLSRYGLTKSARSDENGNMCQIS